MAVRDSFRDFVLEQLGRVGEVTWRRMFGGVGIYSDGVFFAVIDNDVLFFRTGDGNRKAYEDLGMAPFQPMGPGTRPMAYHEVPGQVLEDPRQLAAWMREAVAAAGSGGGGGAGRSRVAAAVTKRPAPAAAKRRAGKARAGGDKFEG